MPTESQPLLAVQTRLYNTMLTQAVLPNCRQNMRLTATVPADGKQSQIQAQCSKSAHTGNTTSWLGKIYVIVQSQTRKTWAVEEKDKNHWSQWKLPTHLEEQLSNLF